MISMFLFGKCISTPHNCALTLKLESLEAHIFCFVAVLVVRNTLAILLFHPSKTIIHENIFFFSNLQINRLAFGHIK